MRQYQLDEIPRPDIPRVREYLDAHAIAAGVEDIWWVDLPEDLLSPEQFSHRDCRPFRFAVEVGDDFVRFEFLIRSRETMRCACIGYATREEAIAWGCRQRPLRAAGGDRGGGGMLTSIGACRGGREQDPGRLVSEAPAGAAGGGKAWRA